MATEEEYLPNMLSGFQDPPSDRFGQATSNDDSPSASSTHSSLDEFSRFKGQTEYQILILQRLVQEMRNTSRVIKEQLEVSARESENAKTSMKTTETRLAQLQKVVAMQTDNMTKWKRDVGQKEAELKNTVEALRKDIVEMKALMINIIIITELRNSRGCTGGGGGRGAANAFIPENLTQRLEALERQSRIYDVGISLSNLTSQREFERLQRETNESIANMETAITELRNDRLSTVGTTNDRVSANTDRVTTDIGSDVDDEMIEDVGHPSSDLFRNRER